MLPNKKNSIMEKMIFTPNYVEPVVKCYKENDFLRRLKEFAPGLESIIKTTYKLVDAKLENTAIDSFGDSAAACKKSWRGARLYFVSQREGKKNFEIALFRVYREGRKLYPKQHGEIRFFQGPYTTALKIGLDKAPLSEYLRMCDSEKTRKKLLEIAEKTSVFYVTDTPLESAESRENRRQIEIARAEMAKRKERMAMERERIARLYNLKN